jgi:hypothetical protein
MTKTQQILYMPVNVKKTGYFCPHRESRKKSKKNFLRNMDLQFCNLFHVHNLVSSEMYAFL